MIKTLVLFVGLLIAVGAIAAAWMGLEVMDYMTKLDNEIYVQKAYNDHIHAGEAGEKKIADIEHQIESKKNERNIWFGAAIGAMAVGLAMALLSLPRKKKIKDRELVPAQNQDASDSSG
jgi:hypothetical protein